MSSWKSYVLEFREEFERKHGGKKSAACLSILIYAIAVSVIERKRKSGVGARELCAQLHNTTAGAFPDNVKYELAEIGSAYSKEFDSVVAKLQEELFESLADDPLNIGFTYQYFRDCDRKLAQKSIQSADKKIDKERLIAFTQIYTPDWIVDFILANTLLPQIDEANSPASLRQWYLDEERQTPATAIEKISILDPACGAGNFLIRAYDALLEQYIQNGADAVSSARHILHEQVCGVDIDEFALSVTACSLIARFLLLQSKTVENVPKLRGLALAKPDDEPLLGSLSYKFSKDHPLSRKHHVVLTNPPYIGRKLISRELKGLFRKHFSGYHQDLSSVFLKRCLDLVHPGGRLGLITQASILFLPSYTRMRETLIDDFQLATVADLGPGAFPLQGGEKVNSAILVIEKPAKAGDERAARFLNLKNSNEKEESLREGLSASKTFVKNLLPSTFRQFHGCAFNYHIPEAVADLLKSCSPLSEYTDIRQGLATTDNDQFVKPIWEVAAGCLSNTWFPYVKGAGAERWYSPVRHAVHWENDGAAIKESVSKRYPYLKGKTEWVVKNESFYFREGLCFSFVNTRGMAVRAMPAGCIFDVGASAIFVDLNNSQSFSQDFLMGYLNSSFMIALASSLNPTINYQVGDLKRLPVVPFGDENRTAIADYAHRMLRAKKELSLIVDCTSWFDPTGELHHLDGERGHGAPIFFRPHELYLQFPEESLESIFASAEEKIDQLELELRVCQSGIDELTMRTIAENRKWNSAAKKEVEEWIESTATPAPKTSKKKRAEPESFLNGFLDNLILIAILGQEGWLPSGEPTLRFTLSDLDTWVRANVGVSLAQYLQSSFLSRVSQSFYGRPPVLIQPGITRFLASPIAH